MFIMDVFDVNWKAVSGFFKISCAMLLTVSSNPGEYDSVHINPSWKVEFVCLLNMVFMNLREMILCVESSDKVMQM